MTIGRAVIQFPTRRVVVQLVEDEAVTVMPRRTAIIRTIGVPGPQGPPGESGGGGSGGTGYTHTQMVANTVWTITHNLGYRPVPQAYDTGDDQILGEVDHINSNMLTITFSDPVSGVAYMS
jgi:hypothetical protein